MLSVSTKIGPLRINTKLLNPLPSKYQWDNGDAIKYQLAPQSPEIDGLVNSFLATEYTNADDAVDVVNNIIKTAANIANIKTKTSSPNRNKQKTKPKRNKKWFDQDCDKIHRELKRTSGKLRTDPSNEQTLHHFRRLRKTFKQLIKHKKEAYKSTILAQLDSLNENNPAEFWKLFNKLSEMDKQYKSNPIPAEESFLEITTSTQPGYGC